MMFQICAVSVIIKSLIPYLNKTVTDKDHDNTAQVQRIFILIKADFAIFTKHAVLGLLDAF